MFFFYICIKRSCKLFFLFVCKVSHLTPQTQGEAVKVEAQVSFVVQSQQAEVRRRPRLRSGKELKATKCFLFVCFLKVCGPPLMEIYSQMPFRIWLTMSNVENISTSSGRYDTRVCLPLGDHLHVCVLGWHSVIFSEE